MKEVTIKLTNNKNEMPIFINIDTTLSSTTYTSLCCLRNKLIESGIIHKNIRHNIYFYKKINGELIKVKENDILEGTIYISIKDEKDYSEPTNILYNLERRIAIFEPIFKESYEKAYHSLNIDSENYIKLKNLWNNFKDTNSDCFDYNDWYFVNYISDQNVIMLLNKISIDIKKWLCQKEKAISEIDLLYLEKITTSVKVNDDDYNQLSKYL